MSGSVGYSSGLHAEGIVSRHYQSKGFKLAETRWRGKCGEIDLIAECDGELVFVEVKKSKTFARAGARLTANQQGRIYHAAEEFLAVREFSEVPDCRFDVALVDQTGRIEILENAIGHH